MNLFENFDSSTSMYLSLNWFSILIPLFMMPYMYWLIPSRYLILWTIMIKSIYKEFELILTNKYMMNVSMFLNLFVFIGMLNFFSLMPYIYTVTSQMSFNLNLALSMWVGLFIYMCVNIPMQFLSHLVPLSTPIMLMHFMVIIETISNLIRPLTLTIRLTANLIAGHLLMTLLGMFMSKLSMLFIFMAVIFQNLLMILEISMSFIQAYVFSILMLLYFSESKK